MSNSATVFLDSRPEGFPGLDVYFRYSTMMRMAPRATDLYVQRVTEMPNMCLTGLAISMPNTMGKNENAVIYTHAEPNNFVFPIDMTKQKNDFDVKEAASLSYHLDLLERQQLHSGSNGFVDPFLANQYDGYVDPFHKSNFKDKSPDYLKINKQFSEYIMDKFIAIRQLKINHLAIRACRIGLNKDFMRFLGKLFGAKLVSAPMLRTAAILGKFSLVKTMTEEERKKFYANLSLFKHGVNGTHMYQYFNPLRKFGITETLIFLFTYIKTGHSTFGLGNVHATHEEAIDEFFTQTVGINTFVSGIRASGVFAAHGLLSPTGLIFPGEAAYQQNLKFVDIK